MMIRYLFAFCIPVLCAVVAHAADEPQGPADLIVHHGKVVTVDAKFRIASAVAVKDGRILAVGDDDDVL